MKISFSNSQILLCMFFICLVGCVQLRETSKLVLGTSTKALEEGRSSAISKTYACCYEDCFDAVLSLGRNEESEPLCEKKYFDVFSKKRNKEYIVVMGIAGNVDTTEVGIFFTRRGLKKVDVEISSRSSSAKRKIAKAVFKELDLRFSEFLQE